MIASMSRRYDYERRPSDFQRRDRYPKDADRRGPSPARFRGSPPPGVFRRRSSDFHDEPRDWDRNKDAHPSHRSPSRKSSSTQSTPIAADKPTDQARHSTKSDSTTEVANIKAFSSLICDKATWVQKRKNAEKNLAKLRADHARSGTKHVEFASVVEIFQNQIKTAENEVSSCDNRIRAIDDKLASDFSSIIPAFSQTASRRDEDLDKRLMQLQTSTAESFRNQLDIELNRLKLRFESDLDGLRTQYETSHKQESKLEFENQTLKGNLDDITQKYHQLEKKLETLDQKQNTSFKNLNERLGDRDEKVDIKLNELESKAESEAAIKNAENETKKMFEGYDSKLSGLGKHLDSAQLEINSIQENIARHLPVTTLPVVEKLSEKLASQQNFLNVLRPLEVLLSKLSKLDELLATLPQLNELSSELPIIRLLVQKWPSLQDVLKQLPNLQKLQNDVITLSKSAKTAREKAEAAFVKVQACSELSQKNEASVESLRSRQETIKSDVISMQSSQSTTPKMPDGINQLLERAPRIDKLLETSQNTLSENDIVKIIKSELADFEMTQPKQPEQIIEQPTQEPSNAMTESEVLRIVTPRLKKVEDGLVGRFQTQFNGIADGVGKFIDKERTARSSTDVSVKELEGRVSELKKATEEAREELTKWKSSIDGQIQSQDSSSMAQRRELSILKNHLAQVHHDLGERMNTHQFQILHLDNWANHFGTKQLYAEIVEHMAATIPSGDQVRMLSERVEALEDRADESRIKKRKLMNGSAAVV